MRTREAITYACFSALLFSHFSQAAAKDPTDAELDKNLQAVLQQIGFSGEIDTKAADLIGHSIDPDKAELGRNLFFDRILSLADDNSCSGCHAPQFGFSDSQSIAIGVGNNCVVGPGRQGPFNQRRSPSVANAVLYPKFMWNGRFSSLSGNPFDNKEGFLFPAPENDTRFNPHGPVKSLMAAQGHMPPTELVEMAGTKDLEGFVMAFSRFGGEFATIDKGVLRKVTGVSVAEAKATNERILSEKRLFAAISTTPVGPCDAVRTKTPEPRAPLVASPNEPIRQAVLKRIEGSGYRGAFDKVFDLKPGADGNMPPLTFAMVGEALAEFQNTLIFANAPIDKFKRGDHAALSDSAKRGALLFFGEAKCVSCHAIKSNASGHGGELFTDFEFHNIGVPPLQPDNDPKKPPQGNFEFANLRDVGLGELDSADLTAPFRFRTSPLRNVALQPTFMHNGSYTRLADAVEHHLNAIKALEDYDRVKAGVKGPELVPEQAKAEIKNSISRELAEITLTCDQKIDLIAFLDEGLTDPDAENACSLIPTSLPSGKPLPKFEGCGEKRKKAVPACASP